MSTITVTRQDGSQATFTGENAEEDARMYAESVGGTLSEVFDPPAAPPTPGE